MPRIPVVKKEMRGNKCRICGCDTINENFTICLAGRCHDHEEEKLAEETYAEQVAMYLLGILAVLLVVVIIITYGN